MKNLLFLFIFVFYSHASGMLKPKINLGTSTVTYRSFKPGKYLEYLRKQPITDVLTSTHRMAKNREIENEWNSNEQKDNPSSDDKEHDTTVQSQIHDGCKVLAERLQDPEQDDIVPLTYFVNAKTKGYFANEMINNTIAANITITKDHLCQNWQTTLEIIKKHRSLFNFPSPLSILKFYYKPVSDQQFIALLMPSDATIKNVNSCAQSNCTIAIKYDTPGNKNVSIYKLPLQNDDNPLLTIKDKTHMISLDISPDDYFFYCKSTEVLDEIFESNEWLSTLDSQEQKYMDDLNSKLTLEEKLRILDRANTLNYVIKRHKYIINEQDTIIAKLSGNLKLVIAGIILSICTIALQCYILTHVSNS